MNSLACGRMARPVPDPSARQVAVRGTRPTRRGCANARPGWTSATWAYAARIASRPMRAQWTVEAGGIRSTSRPPARSVATVNVAAPPRARLLIEVVYDLVCPWCYLGVRRLFRTMRRRPDLQFELVWRPFLLNPDMPRAGMARADYVIRKFGGEERARRLYGSITEIGSAEGVEFRFDRVRRTPSSVDAHRLVRWAAPQGPQLRGGGRPVRRPFRRRAGHRGSGSAPHHRRRAGVGCAGRRPLPPQRRGCGRRPRRQPPRHRLGINGVPCFVVAGRHAIAGAQEPEVIERMLDVAAVDATDS